MNVSYGGPGLAYTGYRRIGPQGLQYATAMRRDYEGFGEYGVVATSANLTRLRKKLAKLKAKRKRGFKWKWQRKNNAKKIRRLQNKIAKLVKKAKKQIARRRSKGKKLSRRQRRLIGVSKALRSQKRRAYQGRSASVPYWFMRKSKRKTRVQRWTAMSASQRRAAFERWKARRRSSQSLQTPAPMLQLSATPLPFIPGSGGGSQDPWESQWNQQDGGSRGGAPTAYPDFTERGAPSDMDMDDGGAEDVGDEIEAIEEDGAKNKIWIYAGLGLAGIAGVYFLTKKKTPAKRSRTGTKAR